MHYKRHVAAPAVFLAASRVCNTHVAALAVFEALTEFTTHTHTFRDFSLKFLYNTTTK